MKITKLELLNFKRFTHLTLDEIPPRAKMVLLIGSNGSGKSSVFDAFEALNKAKRGEGNNIVRDVYYKKNESLDFQINLLTDEEGAVNITISSTAF